MVLFLVACKTVFLGVGLVGFGVGDGRSYYFTFNLDVMNINIVHNTGFDIESKYCDMANKRIKQHLNNPKLF